MTCSRGIADCAALDKVAPKNIMWPIGATGEQPGSSVPRMFQHDGKVETVG